MTDTSTDEHAADEPQSDPSLGDLPGAAEAEEATVAPLATEDPSAPPADEGARADRDAEVAEIQGGEEADGGQNDEGVERTGDSAGAQGDDAAAPADRTGDNGGADAASDPLDVEGEIAADYLEELLDIADLDGDIDTYVESGRAHVSIVTDTDVLVGRNGEVLEALQELARLAVVTETGHRSRMMLDVAGHRDHRRTELVAQATDAIAEAKGSGESVRLAPMNAFERKIVHDAVAAAGLTSESEGEEPGRRVVVLP